MEKKLRFVCVKYSSIDGYVYENGVVHTIIYESGQRDDDDGSGDGDGDGDGDDCFISRMPTRWMTYDCLLQYTELFPGQTVFPISFAFSAKVTFPFILNLNLNHRIG